MIHVNNKIAPVCISIETVKVASRKYIVQVLGVEVSTGGSIESNVRLFEAFVTILYNYQLHEIFNN
jgi:hypothetical protein